MWNREAEPRQQMHVRWVERAKTNAFRSVGTRHANLLCRFRGLPLDSVSRRGSRRWREGARWSLDLVSSVHLRVWETKDGVSEPGPSERTGGEQA